MTSIPPDRVDPTRRFQGLETDAEAPVELHNARSAPTPDDRILYVSMNRESAAAELGALKAYATNVGHSAKNDTIDFGGRTWDLRNSHDVSAFAAALGVSNEVGNLILAAKPGSRDELARI